MLSLLRSYSINEFAFGKQSKLIALQEEAGGKDAAFHRRWDLNIKTHTVSNKGSICSFFQLKYNHSAIYLLCSNQSKQIQCAVKRSSTSTSIHPYMHTYIHRKCTYTQTYIHTCMHNYPRFDLCEQQWPGWTGTYTDIHGVCLKPMICELLLRKQKHCCLSANKSEERTLLNILRHHRIFQCLPYSNEQQAALMVMQIC